MNSSDYTFLLNQPGAVSDRQTEALEKIVTEFPYFQSARALRLKGLYNQNSFQYNFALKVTAAYTTDRSVLFDFITSDTFTAIHKGLYDRKLAELNGIDVNESEHVIEQNDEPGIDKVEQSILTSIRESETPYEEEVPTVEETETILNEEVPEENIQEETLTEIPPVDAMEEIDSGVSEQPEQTETVNHEVQEIAFESAVEVAPDLSVIEQPEQIQTPEAKLHIGEPLEFSKTETHSFQEWLQLSRIQPIQREEVASDAESSQTEGELSEAKTKKNAIIDRFIETNPKIPQMKPDAKPAVIAEPKEDHSALMTETLARVYLEQKKYQKAIQAYEILILKYPEKSSFFADRISEIKNLQQNNTL